MIRSKAKFRRNRIIAMAWLAAFVAGFMIYWLIMVNYGIRDFWDPTYAEKSERLSALVKNHPGRPLWVVLGTSHVEFGLRLWAAEDLLSGSNAPWIFNFGLSGAGVYRQSVVLKRLVADHLKPQRVGIELMGPLMGRDDEMFADDPRLAMRARRSELDDLCSHSSKPDEIRADWKESRLNPCYEYGMRLPDQTLTLRLLPIPGIRHFESHAYDAWGWCTGVPQSEPEDRYRAGFKAAAGEFVKDFSGNFAISKAVDGELRAALDLCRKEGIEAFLVRMPEARDFQAIYTSQANTALANYVEQIKNEYHVPVIDARSWFPEGKDFLDGHHLNAISAQAFTRQFVQELLKK